MRDTGPGIPEEEIPIVMSSFGRGSLAQKNAEEGTGLGLPIVKGLVELHGGDFTLKSKVREGTEVIVVFPARAGDGRAAAIRSRRWTAVLRQAWSCVKTMAPRALRSIGLRGTKAFPHFSLLATTRLTRIDLGERNAGRAQRLVTAFVVGETSACACRIASPKANRKRQDGWETP